ncbi:MAG: polyphosphate polymerase domain-containing protein [Eubacteriales bacterium]|nr:polyphosphate polymerase domain-containing protein [Eubacteriales bacterium]
MSSAKPHKPAYRHELKYYLNQGEYTLLHQRLRRAMEQDAHARKQGGEYFIRSLYFDDYNDGALRTKLDGLDNRDKYRIRIYNMQDDVIKLERKHKKEGYILKDSLSLNREEAEALIDGAYSFLSDRPEPFAKAMFGAFAGGLKPVVIVDYTREPYVFPLQDVRVTFDKNIRTGYRSVDLFNPDIVTYPVIDGYDMVMEVKFNQYLSTYIRSLIQTGSAQQSAISKYCLCRKYEL